MQKKNNYESSFPFPQYTKVLKPELLMPNFSFTFYSIDYDRKSLMQGQSYCFQKNPVSVPNYLFGFLFVLFNHGYCKSEIHTGYRLNLAVPFEYSIGFIGRAFLMETNQTIPNFSAALSVEAFNGKYSCSLEIFLGGVKVWNSGHYSKFYVSDKCVLQLTEDGELQLMGQNNRIGWRTGTSAQGVERLQILETGNLVLVDGSSGIKWQSFNFPTDVILWGQRLNVATRLTSFPLNSSNRYYSFEIQRDRIALFLHSGMLNYSYWEFKPSKNRNISFIALTSKGLNIYNDRNKKIAQIYSQSRRFPLRFLALGNETGNLGLYYYSVFDQNFRASFRAINATCDLPLACKPSAICTFSETCSSLQLLTRQQEEDTNNSICASGEGGCGGLCGGDEAEMLEIQGVSSVLRDSPKGVNISGEECENLCRDDCECVAALYEIRRKECFVYGVVIGVKQVEKGDGFGSSYMVKVPKGTKRSHNNKSNVKKWVFILVGVVDGLIIVIGLGGLAYYLIRKRRNKSSMDVDNRSN